MIPYTVTVDDYRDFFEPLGTYEELSKLYNFIEPSTIEGQVYSIPMNVSISGGILYDKKVFEEAGITEFPDNLEEFSSSLRAIKEKTKAVPIFTNKRSPWLLSMWESVIISLSGDGNYRSSLIHTDQPFAEGGLYQRTYKVLYDAAKQGFVEEVPSTATWGDAVGLFAQGKLGAVVVGADKIEEVKKAALNAEYISYMSFESEKDGKYYLNVQPGYGLAINVNSKNKEAARAWLDFLVNESGYIESVGGSWVLKKNKAPEYVRAFEDIGIQFIKPDFVDLEERKFFDKLDSESELGFKLGVFPVEMIDAALNNDATYEEICNKLNDKWEKARKALGTD